MNDKIKVQRNFRDNTDNFCVSTIKTNERNENQFETALSSRRGLTKTWKVVELYDTFEESKKGHYKWLDLVQKKNFDISEIKEVFYDYHIDESKVEVIDNIKVD